MEHLSPHIFQQREWNLLPLQPDNFPRLLYQRIRSCDFSKACVLYNLREELSDGCEWSQDLETLWLLVLTERNPERHQGELRARKCPAEQRQEDRED